MLTKNKVFGVSIIYTLMERLIG